jgi:hypothetical protein
MARAATVFLAQSKEIPNKYGARAIYLPER